MKYVKEDECVAAGLDPKKVESIARRISKIAREAESMGITIFGGSRGSLRFRDDADERLLVVADLDGMFDGGCGATHYDANGLLRGE